MTDESASPAAEASESAGEEKVPQQPIVATYGRYYRNARYIMVLAVFVMAGWFGYDGWVRYPAKNERFAAVTAEIAKLSGATSETDKARLAELDKERKKIGDEISEGDIRLQKRIAVVLPLVGLGYAAFVVYRSRGKVRLENDTLHSPGHPPVRIDQISALDGKLWRKKGIAYASYKDVESKSGTIRLDAFIYDPKPMDDIYEVIARHHGIWEQTKPLPASAAKAK